MGTKVADFAKMGWNFGKICYIWAGLRTGLLGSPAVQSGMPKVLFLEISFEKNNHSICIQEAFSAKLIPKGNLR